MKQLIHAMRFKGMASGQDPSVASLDGPSGTIALCIRGARVSRTITPDTGDSACFKSVTDNRFAVIRLP